MMQGGNEKLCVPPGFRFHPTEEELVYYYLRKKISYEAIDLDVIKEVDLNKLEPWDLKEKCRIGSGPQNEWYLFSHKDKKYPTGTRTNRATEAGFWKATGRDKAIHLMTNSKRIGMRKTLVFYTGRAPRGHKTDWIMHEYRLDDAENAHLIQEDGWVICRVFKKKNHNSRGFHSEIDREEEQIIPDVHATVGLESKRSPKQAHYNNFYTLDQHSNSNMNLPQLLSPESILSPSFLSSLPLINTIDTSKNNQIKLTSGGAGTSIGGGITLQQNSKFYGDWSFLDKLLTTHHTMDQINRSSCHQFSQISEFIPQYQRLSFSNNGFDTDFSKYND